MISINLLLKDDDERNIEILSAIDEEEKFRKQT